MLANGEQIFQKKEENFYEKHNNFLHFFDQDSLYLFSPHDENFLQEVRSQEYVDIEFRKKQSSNIPLPKTSPQVSKSSQQIKKNSKSLSNYKKNICGYITKKVMRQFTSETYRKLVQQMCQNESIDYQSIKNHYHSKIERITGPSHIPALFQSSKEEDASMARVFLSFFKWFLKQRYIRHLLLQGKMQLKKFYVQFKSRVLLPMIQQIEKSMVQQVQLVSTLIEMNEFSVQTLV